MTEGNTASVAATVGKAVAEVDKAVRAGPQGQSTLLLGALWQLQQALDAAAGAGAARSANALAPHIGACTAALLAAAPAAGAAPVARLLAHCLGRTLELGWYTDREHAARTLKALLQLAGRGARDARAAVLRVLGATVAANPRDTHALHADIVAAVKKNLREGSALCPAALDVLAALARAWPDAVPALTALLAKHLRALAADRAPADVRLHTAQCLAAVNTVAAAAPTGPSSSAASSSAAAATHEARLHAAVALLAAPEDSVRAEAANALAVLLLHETPDGRSTNITSAAGPAGTSGTEAGRSAQDTDKQHQQQKEGGGSSSKKRDKKEDKKGKGKDSDDDEEEESSKGKNKGSGDKSVRRHVTKNAYAPVLAAAFRTLEPLMLRADASAAFREAVAQVYVRVLGALGGADIDYNMEAIVDALFGVLARPRAGLGAQAALQTRACVSAVLRALGDALREGQQRRLARLLGDQLARADASDGALVAALRELCVLVAAVGAAGADVPEWLVPPVTALLAHSAVGVRLAAATCLRALGHALPAHLAALLRLCLDAVTRANDAVATATAPADLARAVLALRGHGVAVAALVADIAAAPFGVPADLWQVALVAARTLLVDAPLRDFKAEKARKDVAWSVVAALLGNDKAAETLCRALPALEPHWAAALACPAHAPRTPSDATLFVRGKCTAVWALSALCRAARASPSAAVRATAAALLPRLAPALARLLAVTAALARSVLTTSTAVPPILRDNICLLAAALLALYRDHPAGPALARPALPTLAALVALLISHGVACTCVRALLTQDDDIIGCWNAAASASTSSSGASSGIAAVTAPQDSQAPAFGHVWDPAIDVALSEHPAPAVEAANSAVRLAAHLIASLDEHEQLVLLAPLTKCVASKGVALRTNVITICLAALRAFAAKDTSNKGDKDSKDKDNGDNGTTSTSTSKRPAHHTSAAVRAIVDIVNALLTDGDVVVRRAAAESLGLVCNLSGREYTAACLQSLALRGSQAASSDDTRCGSVLGVGCILRAVGGIGAATYIQTAARFLHSAVAGAATPALQVTALHALSLAIDCAGLAYPCRTALQLLVQVLHSPAHCGADGPGGAGAGHVLRAVGEVANAVVGALGPELDGTGSVMRVCTIVNEELRHDARRPLVVLESVRFYQRLIMFAPHAVRARSIVPLLEAQLASPWLAVRQQALTCLRQLVQGPWRTDLRAATFRIATRLFEMLDSESNPALLKEGELVLTTLIESLAHDAPARWLAKLCDIVLTTHSTNKSAVPVPGSGGSNSGSGSGAASSSTAAGNASAQNRGDDDDDDDDDDEEEDEDEEEGGLNVGESDNEEDKDEGKGKKDSTQKKSGNGGTIMSAQEVEELDGPQNELVPRWRTKVFAMECVHRLLETVRAQPDSAAHFDMVRAAALATADARRQCLVSSVADLVKLVFFVATSPIDPLRPTGVRLMGDLVHYFGASLDPLAPGHRLLELYEVQFSSALARAFQPDAPPLATSRACAVLVDLLACGVCAPASVPALVAHLTGALAAPHARARAQYSESAGTLVHVALLRALARLAVRAPALPREYQPPVAAALAACRARLQQHWRRLLQDHAVLACAALAPAQRHAYRAALFVPCDEAAARTWLRDAWLDVALAACTALADASAPVPVSRQHLVLVLGLLTQELVSLSSTSSSGKDSEDEGECERAAVVVQALGALFCRAAVESGAFTAQHVAELLALLAHCAAARAERLLAHRAFFAALAALVQQLATAAPPALLAAGTPAPLWDRLLALQARVAQRLVAVLAAHRDDDAPAAIALAERVVAALTALARALPSTSAAAEQQQQQQEHAQQLVCLVLALLTAAAPPDTAASAPAPAPIALASAQAVRTALEHAPDAAALAARVAATLAHRTAAFTAPGSGAAALALAAALAVLVLRPAGTLAPALLGAAAAALRAPHAPARRPVLDVLLAVLPATAGTAELRPRARALLGACGPALAALAAHAEPTAAPTAALTELADVVRVVLLAQPVAVPGGGGPAAVGAALAVLQPLLAPDALPGTPRATLHAAAFQAVMHLATASAADFRAHVAALDPAARAALEGAMRASAEAAARAAALQQAQQAQQERLRQAAAARAKPLSLDFSKYSK